jgi:hypothetical protein
MTKSLRLLTSGLLGRSLSLRSESSSGRESKSPRSELKRRIINRATEALSGITELGQAQRKLIIGLITQALDTTTDDRILALIETANDEFEAILSEFTEG